MALHVSPRDLAYAGLMGAAALLLPALFHLLHLGHVFMPMYLPLVALGFLVGARAASATALVVPLLSGVITGMPPFHPPTAPFMAAELAVMAGLVSWGSRRWPGRVLVVLVPVLLLGRVLQAGAGYVVGLVLELPAGFMSAWAVAKGWPGLVLMVVVIPPLVRLVGPARGGQGAHNGPA
jgi:hypothetical protein